jgi:hypothetical protein
MSAVQHAGARRLLQLIQRSAYRSGEITYGDAAVHLGRPRNHGRAIAQMCDLLDAAAAYAGIPLLALIAIRSGSHAINPNAWAKNVEPGLRDKIIARSQAHTFSTRDFTAIRTALERLEGMGNHAAWVHVYDEIGRPLVFAAISGVAPSPQAVAASRKSDQEYEALEGNRRLVKHFRQERDPGLVKRKKSSSKVTNGGLVCEGCSTNSKDAYPGLKNDPWEVHHRLPLSGNKKPTTTKLKDLAILCPNCHRSIHRTRPMLSVQRFKARFFKST